MQCSSSTALLTDRLPAEYQSAETIRFSSISVLLSRLLVAIAFTAQIVVAWRYWSLTWDDSAITLGFSRSFALTGHVEPTPGSGIVEGYSTTLWMLLMALAAKFVVAPAAILITAKISTLLLNLINILLIRRWFLTWTSEVCANLIAGSMGCGLMFYETINGMETPLLLFLAFTMLLLLPSESRVARFCYLLAGADFLLVRWESAWLLVPFILVEPTIRRALISSGTWFAAFITSNLIRWRYFGSILPNTIIAKQGAPYSVPGLKLQRHLSEPFAIVAYCKALLIILAVTLLYNRFIKKRYLQLQDLPKSFQDSWQLRFTILYVIFSLVLSTAIGVNWGPEFRSFYTGFPFLFGLVLLPIVSSLRGRPLVLATVAICAVALLRMSLVSRDLNSPDAPLYESGATVVNVAATGARIAQLQEAAHRDTLLYAGPDMGGILLYSNGVRIIDLGLLVDPVLSRLRYDGIETYVLQQRKPDIIEVHQRWTTYTKFHESSLFKSNYRPVYINGERFFLRNSFIAAIDPARLTEKRFTPAGDPQEADMPPAATNSYYPPDYTLNKDFGTYLAFH